MRRPTKSVQIALVFLPVIVAWLSGMKIVRADENALLRENDVLLLTLTPQ